MKKITDIIPQALWDEARKDPGWSRPLVFNRNKPLLPIKEDGVVVGFHMPTDTCSLGKPSTGNIYVAKAHRKKGVAKRVLAAYLKKHPDCVSFINKKNKASKEAHTAAGFEFSKIRSKNDKDTEVWVGKSKTSRIADRIIKRAGLQCKPR
jgi:GNAT superfamily N-acetyltransferase